LDALDLSPWQHQHIYIGGSSPAEKRTWRVVALTASMMVAEIVTGLLFNSMAVLADGWHMSTHAAALGITAIAYVVARRSAGDNRYAFGTWKVEVLGGFASAIILAIVALYMAGESIRRLAQPLVIRYDQALIVAVVGLIVNLASARLLIGRGGSDEHAHVAHAHEHSDLNLRAAYLHVLADATTSVLAILALIGGKWLGWAALDPLMGIVGAILVSVWAYGLLRDTSRVLLDREMDHGVVGEICAALEADGQTRVTDLHVWRVGRAQYACAVSLVACSPRSAEEYKALLRVHEEIVHVTIEVAACEPGAGL
jgi:cation diffusion facilitator family transporter